MLSIFMMISLYLYQVEKIKVAGFWRQFIIWFPAFIIFAFLYFQDGVGTDYETYYNYFYNDGHFP